MRRAVPLLSRVAAATLIGVAPLAAQVGHSPTDSPYRDIVTNRWLDLSTGRVLGTGGPLLLGPRDGTIAGARITFRGAHTLGLGLGAWWAGTVRNVIDANDSVATRVKGPVDHHLLAGEFTMQLNLTGSKSWHRLAPFIATGIGLVHGQATPASDSSGYSFGTKFFFAPSLGTRLMVSRSIALRFEARSLFWNLKYPPAYSLEPSKQPGTNGTSNAVNVTGKSSQYVATPTLLFGLSVRF